jgi:nitroreductase
MNFEELVIHRQSVRSYKNTPVENKKIVQCVESARLAQSANNSQPWKLIIIDNPDLKEKVAECASGLGMNNFTHQAPVIIAVVLENMKVLSALASIFQRKQYSLIDLGIVVNQFCLQAADLGLGTCVVGWFNENKVKKILNLPKNKRIPALITIGYSDTPLRPKIRKPTEEISNWNGYRS